MVKIKAKNRGEAIKDLSNKMADHADAIGEVRSAIQKEVKGRDETDAEFSRQFEELVTSITTAKKIEKIKFAILFKHIEHYKEVIAFESEPWWRRLWRRLKGDNPWKRPVKIFIEKEPEALEDQTGEPSSTSSPTDAVDDSCTKSSEPPPTSPKNNMDTSSEDRSSNPSLPTTQPNTLESDSDDPEPSPPVSPPTGGTGTPTDS